MFTEEEINRRKTLNEQGYWEIPEGLDTSNFDFDWRPEYYERPYIHQFGTQHQKTGGPKFVVPENEGTKYQTFQKAIKLPNNSDRNWRALNANATIDFSWHPDENDPPFIYVFGNQWYDAEVMPTYQYRVKGATEKKYVNDVRATLLADSNNRCWRQLVSNATIDFSWIPHPWDPPYIYVFGNQWYNAEVMPTYQYKVKGATEKKYVNEIKAKLLLDSNNRCWRQLIPNATIDFSWIPHPGDPPYIYVFGNQWHDAETMPTYQYKVKGATEKKYVNEIKATLLSTKENWDIPTDIDDSNFDYSWVPNPYEPHMNWQFGTQWQQTGGPKYLMQNPLGTKYIECQKVKKLANMRNWRMIEGFENFDYSWHPDDREPPLMYEFGTQHQKAGGPIYVTKGSTQKKYCSDQVAYKTTVDERNYRPLKNNISFDYTWHPDPNDPPYIYVFGNQWYDAETMPTLLYRVKGAVDKKYMTDIKCTLLPDKTNWNVPDNIEDDFDYSWLPHPNEPPFIWQFGTQWQKTDGPQYIAKNATVLKYTDELKATRKTDTKAWRIIETVDQDAFDFSWHPDSTEKPYNYIFGNDIHDYKKMPTLMYKMKGSIGTKYIDDVKPKLKIDEIKVDDSIFDCMVNTPLDFKYTYFGTQYVEFRNLLKDDEKLNVMHIIDNVAAVIPKEAKSYLYDKLHDYPYIKYHNLGYSNKPLDIIFISNGEKIADENFEHLLSITKGIKNNVIRVKDINGRVSSQHHAANLASTPWYFLVNAKCKVNKDFDWSWQPDRMVNTKHYIFTATNNANGLEYGHMAIVANNKRLTLETQGTELDFTLEKPHEVIEINSGIGIYNTSEWDTWRTSFREVLKLKYNVEILKDNASIDRLNIWLTHAKGDFAHFSIEAAEHAVEYYESVNGEFDKLKLSYDWQWLNKYFKLKYGN